MNVLLLLLLFVVVVIARIQTVCVQSQRSVVVCVAGTLASSLTFTNCLEHIFVPTTPKVSVVGDVAFEVLLGILARLRAPVTVKDPNEEVLKASVVI